MRREDLSLPRQRRRLGVHYDTDQFGQFSESVARFIGTARFLVFQSVVCVLWTLWNLFGPRDWRFDDWPFIGLTLLLSLQAAYAAPLILLAQTRLEQRDRTQNEVDRRVSERTQADTEFLAREIASVRLALADVATTGEIDDRLDSLQSALAGFLEKLDAMTERAEDADATPVSEDSTSRPATA